MLVLISDYKDQMETDYTWTMESVKELLTDVQFAIEPYDTPAFYEALKEAEGLITAFIPVNDKLLERAPKLRCVSQNAAGYSNVDVEALQKRGVALRYIKEYCTREVAEHAIALMLALNHQLIGYTHKLEKEKEWKYQCMPAGRTLNHQTLAIFGLGKIGKTTAKLALALGMQVIAVDPYVEPGTVEHVAMVSKEEALSMADVIVNHMALTADNYHYFDGEAFKSMKKKPAFINVGRGGCVDEAALLEALTQGWVRGAGLDVLESEHPDMEHCPFLNRNDVVLTPHSAFYSEDSILALHKISGRNLAEVLAK